MIPWIINRETTSVAVLGDIILDEYLEGDVTRISPEAPVPIHLVKKDFFSAGGAANTARNIQLAGGRAYLLGVWGCDSAAQTLRKILEEDDVDTSGVIADQDRHTVKKTRILCGHQQMLRVDWEKNTAITSPQELHLIEHLRSLNVQSILISDYGKGVLSISLLSAVFELAREKNIPTIVDPKGKDFHRYQGCQLITPNKKEACEALGLDPLEPHNPRELGLALQKKFGLHDVLITLGAEGMILIPKDHGEKSFHRKAQAKEVYDVSGAGDTVAAIMALSIGCKVPLIKAVNLANLAASIVVEKKGTQPIRRQELEKRLSLEPQSTSFNFSTRHKILPLDELMNRLHYYKTEKKRIVFTNGCFDLLHAGHLTYLENSRSLGDILVVGVNSDSSVKRLKGPKRPLIPVEQRMQLLAGLECISYVVSFSEDTPELLIKALIPNVLVKAADYKVEDIVGADIVKKHGGVVQTVDFVPGLSTTEIIRRASS